MTYGDKSFWKVLSKDPLWILLEEGNAEIVPNTFSDLEVIRIYYDEHTYQDIPIEDPITLALPIGGFFFKTQRDAVRYNSIMDCAEGYQTVLENMFEQTKKSKSIIKLNKNEPVEDGLYVFESFDEHLPPHSDVFRMGYFDEKCNTHKFKQSTPALDKYLVSYLNMLDIERTHDLTKERFVLEVYTENKHVYLNHMFLNHGTMTNVYAFSRILNHAIVYLDQAEINRIQFEDRCFGNEIHQRQSVLLKLQDNEAKRQYKKTLAKKISIEIGKFAWSKKDVIWEFLKKGLKIG